MAFISLRVVWFDRNAKASSMKQRGILLTETEFSPSLMCLSPLFPTEVPFQIPQHEKTLLHSCKTPGFPTILTYSFSPLRLYV